MHTISLTDLINSTPYGSGVIVENIIASGRNKNGLIKKIRLDVKTDNSGNVKIYFHVIEVQPDNCCDYLMSVDSLPEAIEYYNTL